MAEIEVRFFAAARAAAGRASQRIQADDLGELIRRLGAQHGPQLATVLEHSSFLIDGRRAEAAAQIAPGTEHVDVLPPFAGG